KQGTRMLSILPLHHTFENTCGLFVALFFGCEIVICDGLRHIQKNLQEYHIDMIIGVPAVFESFYNKVQASLKKAGKDKLIHKMIPLTEGLRKIGIDLRRKVYGQILDAFGGQLKLGICGAAPIDPDIIRFFDAVGLRILQGYGLTETSPVVSGCNDRDFVPGTVGYPVAGVEIAVDSDQPGEPGEILVRGPIVMIGYYQDPQATAEVIDRDGWFHTGDIGTINPTNNFLSITGRLKSMIVLKNGKKVFPEEIEFIINQNAFIKESLVWGELEPGGDVVVNAKIVLDREQVIQEGITEADETALKNRLDQIISDINRHLPSFKSVRNYVYSFQEMVKTTTLKIRRPIEIASIQRQFEKLKLSWRDLTGKNLDRFDGKPKEH
ncbi:MAG: AMP-binding protein, partial [Bacillota bacterium]|nr:AMP-binding protein [Bacillota bacterium]